MSQRLWGLIAFVFTLTVLPPLPSPLGTTATAFSLLLLLSDRLLLPVGGSILQRHNKISCPSSIWKAKVT